MLGSPENGSPENRAPRPEKRKSNRSTRTQALAASGAEFGLTIAVLALVGSWLDKKMGTTPGMLLGGVMIGAVGGMYKLWSLQKRFYKDREVREDKPDKPDRED